MNLKDLPTFRLNSHHLLAQDFDDPVKVVEHLGAVQAQDYVGGLLTIGMRIKGSTENIVEEQVKNGKIIRTWPMRGTIHFVSAQDVHWMVKLLAPRVVKKYASLYRKLEIDDETFNKSRKLIVKALEKEKFLTRTAIYEILNKAGISTNNMRGVNILNVLCMESLLCLGPRNDKEYTFRLLDEWVPKHKELSNDEALAKLALRYFTSHGPAQLKDFTWWSGLLVTEAKVAIELIKDKLEQNEIEGNIYYSVPSSKMMKIPSPKIHLLQAYDEYTVSYKDRSAIFDYETHAEKLKAGINFNSIVIKDGIVIGFWKRTIKKDKVLIDYNLLEKLDSKEKEALDKAFLEYATFIEKDI